MEQREYIIWEDKRTRSNIRYVLDVRNVTYDGKGNILSYEWKHLSHEDIDKSWVAVNADFSDQDSASRITYVRIVIP